VRTGWFREVHVKSEESYRLRLLLTQRRNLKRKFLDIENAIRHSIKTFGLKVGKVSRGRFEARVRELVAGESRRRSMIRTGSVARRRWEPISG
jgi:transposase